MAAQIQVTPAPVAFGNVRQTATTQPKTVNIRNVGDAPLIITITTGLSINSGPYAIVGFPTVPLLSAITIAPGDSIDLGVTFTPPGLGSQPGVLRIISNISTVDVALSGTGVVGATLTQTRDVSYIDAVVSRYNVTSTLTDKGPLPSTYVFVMKIFDRSNAKADVLQRIGRIADITTLPQGRDAALLATPTGVGMEFLTPTVMLGYTDLATAEAGALAVKDRLNALVTSYLDYSTNFFNTLEVIPLPVMDKIALTALIEVYRLAKVDRRVKSTANDVATAAVAAATAALSGTGGLNDQVTELQLIDVTEATSVSVMQAASTAMGVAIVGGFADAAALSIAKAVLDAAITVAISDETAVDAYLAALIVTQAAATKTFTAATTTAAQAAQNLTNATLAETTALSNVLAVCPSFDSTTVCAG